MEQKGPGPFNIKGGQGPPEGTDPEDSEKCPICLSVMSGAELAMPDSCCHVFCLRCLLTWAEVRLNSLLNVRGWDDNHSVKDEEKEDSPTEEQEDSALWDNEKVSSPEQGAMDISDEDDKESTAGESVEKTESITETEAAREETNELKDKTDEAYDTLEVESKSPRQSDQSVMVSESVDTISKDEDELKEKEDEKDAKNLSLTEDMNEVPMDFGSPLSEHGSGTPMEKDSLEQEQSGDQPKDEDVSKSEDKKTVEKRDKDKSPERSKPRRSRFHSPTTSWSPKRDLKDSKRDKRSKSRERNGSPNRSARRSRERDGDYHRRDRSRERRRRRSRSRSRSRSRNRSYRRGDRSPAEERRDERRERGGRRGERRGGMRGGRRGEKRGGRSLPLKMRDEERGGLAERRESSEEGDLKMDYTNPDWVEKQRLSMSAGAPKWDDPPRGRGRGGKGGFDRGRGRGGGNWSSYNQDEPGDNRWPRNNFSGTGSGNSAPGSDAYSRFNENRGGRRKESDPSEAMDRSGWSSASSWAVRRTLPADVQDYYSKRERGGAGGWSRQEEEQPAATGKTQNRKPFEPNLLVSAHPQLLHHYPGARGPVTVSLQPAAPYALPPSQVPVQLHTAVPLLQVPAVGHRACLLPLHRHHPCTREARQQPLSLMDTLVKSFYFSFSYFSFYIKLAIKQSILSQLLRTMLNNNFNFQQKQQIQERAINEVKTAIKPYYQKNEITKEEYKEIVRKAVEKVCHSKSGEVNSGKVANLVKAYVDKYKHARKK
uniref:SFR19-like C-terminal domain-containing protein n=1 Tax=Neogobius melanostomus TaxID=47308 RepID=A0A8C6U764_9GOBI